MLDQFVGGLPCRLVGMADDDMQPNAERDLAAALLGDPAHACNLLRDLRRGLAPGQVFVDGIDGDIDAGIRRAAKIEWRMGCLDRWIEDAAVFDRDVLARDSDGFAGELPRVNIQKLTGDLIAFVVIEEDAIALVLDGIAARHDVDEQSSVGQAIQRGSHARCRYRGRLQSGSHGDEIAQSFRPRRDGRCDDPGVFAIAPGREQGPVIAELVRGTRNLPQIVEIDLARTGRGSEIVAVAAGRQEPENLESVVDCGHGAGVPAASATAMAFGISPSARNVSASCCCSVMTLRSIGLIP